MRFGPRLAALAAATLVSAAFPASAETLTVTDITSASPGGLSLSVPTVEATDANLDEAAIRALFTFNDDYSEMFSQLSELDAASIRIPELTLTFDQPMVGATGTVRTAMTYRDLELQNVVDGVASGASLGAVEVVGVDDARFTLGRMSADLFDIGAILRFYGLAKSDPGDMEMKPIYRNFTFEGGAFGPADGVTCTIGGGGVEEFRARPLTTSFADLVALTAELETAEQQSTAPSSETTTLIFRMYADMLTAFSSTSMGIDGIECSSPDPSSGATISFRTGNVSVGGFEPGFYPPFTLSDVAIEHSAEGFVRVGSAVWKAMDFNTAIAAVLGADVIDEAWLEANWRALLPAFEGFAFTDLDIDVPDESNPGKRIVAKIDAFDLSLADFVNGIPTTIVTTGTNIDPRFTEAEMPELAALGLLDPSMDFDLRARWNEADNTITLERMALNGDKLGTVELSATLANAGPELFASDMQVAEAAAMALTVTELTLRLENQGFLPALIALSARDLDQAPEMSYAMLAGSARALPIALLGASEEALALSGAVGDFLNGTPNLTITLRSVDPAGIGMALLEQAENDPTALNGKITVTAEATGEPVPLVFPELPPKPTTQVPVEAAPEPAPEMTPPVANPPPSAPGHPRYN